MPAKRGSYDITDTHGAAQVSSCSPTARSWYMWFMRSGRRNSRLIVACLFAMSLPAASTDLTADRIVVNKSKREMLLQRDGRVIRRYRIGLGQSPVGPKQREGDGKTPEGSYTISGRNPASAYHLSLRISYPNAADIERARQAGVDPGGDIMIHGLPNAEPKSSKHSRMTDWTLGCIAVTDEEIEEIWRLIPEGTPIQINR
jgi:murein L,D-transpeptidase YafK